jgi:hypothetical protein
MDGNLRCSKLGDPRCDGVDQVCLPLGELCETGCECCTGRCDRPLRESVPDFSLPKRCVGAEFPVCLERGSPCGDPGECCDQLCLAWPDGVYRCGSGA